MLGIRSGAFHVEHKLWSIGSLAIVSLGVSYKYILAFSVERKLWNCTMFVTPFYRHEPIDHDDYIDVLFYIGSKTPLHMNIMILLYIGRKPIVDDIYVYIC